MCINIVLVVDGITRRIPPPPPPVDLPRIIPFTGVCMDRLNNIIQMYIAINIIFKLYSYKELMTCMNCSNYLCSHKVPPSLQSNYSKLLVENGCTVLRLVGSAHDKQRCLGLCYQQTSNREKKAFVCNGTKQRNYFIGSLKQAINVSSFKEDLSSVRP